MSEDDRSTEEWQREIDAATAAFRTRFSDLKCLRCGHDNFYRRLFRDPSLAPGLADDTNDRVVELICKNCGFQEKHVVNLLKQAS